MNDLKMAQQDESVIAGPVNEDDLFHWRATITGPEDTAWDGAILHLSLDFSDEYPQVPPNVKFITKGVFHPNVYTDGNICLDILKTQWSPSYDVCALLVSIQSLLADPNPASAANTEAAELHTNNRILYEQRVRAVAERSLREAEEAAAAGDDDEEEEEEEDDAEGEDEEGAAAAAAGEG